MLLECHDYFDSHVQDAQLCLRLVRLQVCTAHTTQFLKRFVDITDSYSTKKIVKQLKSTTKFTIQNTINTKYRPQKYNQWNQWLESIFIFFFFLHQTYETYIYMTYKLNRALFLWLFWYRYLSLALFAWRLSLSLWALITGSSSSSSALEQLREFLLYVLIDIFHLYI